MANRFPAWLQGWQSGGRRQFGGWVGGRGFGALFSWGELRWAQL